MMLKSVYRRAADYGLIFGVFLSVLFFMIVSSTSIPLFSFVALGLFFAIPGVLFFFLRHCYVQENGTSTFSSLWMLGMLIFIFGSLICGMVTYIYFQFIEPTFIYDQARLAITLYKQLEGIDTTVLVDTLQLAIDQKLLPTPIQFTFQMIWITSFLGSILSMLTSFMVRLIRIRIKKTN